MKDFRENVQTTHHHPRSLLPYHKHKHQSATKLLINLFTEYNGGWFMHNRECQQLGNSLEKINERIRTMNREHGEKESLGIIDYNTIAYGWEYTRWKVKPSVDMEQWHRQKLVDFCKRRQYPMGWSKMPPVHNLTYELYEPAYWEKEWDVFVPWLTAIWLMRMRQVEQETIKDMEMAMRRQETMFNNRLREKNERIGANPFTHFLGFTTILDVLESMQVCLVQRQKVDSTSDTGFEPRHYQSGRETLRQICELNGYPQAWISTNFEGECATLLKGLWAI
jgi:hypothetical protein